MLITYISIIIMNAYLMCTMEVDLYRLKVCILGLIRK